MVQGKSLLPRLADHRRSVSGVKISVCLPGTRPRRVARSCCGWIRHLSAGCRIRTANDMINNIQKDFGADVVVTLIDTSVLRDTAQKVASAKWLPAAD